MTLPYRSFLRSLSLTVTAVVLGLATTQAQAQLSFTRLGALTYPTHVSDDGVRVVGRNYPGYGLYRWSAGSGAVLLKENVVPGGVSADGQTIVATPLTPNSGITGDAIYKFAGGTGYTVISATDQRQILATGLSGDGRVTVGTIGFGAARWVDSTPELLGTVPGGGRSAATAISADGRTIVGYVGVADPNVTHAFRWTESGGMVDMGLLGGFSSGATDVSSDGTFIVGSGVRSAVNGGIRSFIWSEATGATAIQIGFATFSEAVSDGALVAGYYYAKNFSLEQGFLWSPESGARDFRSVMLGDYGFGSELDDWQSLVPTEVSTDGRYVVGYGYSTAGLVEGWLLDRGLNPPPISPVFSPVPEPGTYGALAASLLCGVILAKRRRRTRA